MIRGTNPLTNAPTVNDLRFEQWQERFNVQCLALCGVDGEDLPDFDTYSAWDNGDSPKEAAKNAIEAAQNY